MDANSTGGEGGTSLAEGAPGTGRPATPLAMLTALGVVYGDIGTSPLYTYQTLIGDVGGHPQAQEALGLLSLVVWALIVVIAVKYCLLAMRADNHGEGGILALMQIVTGGERRGAVAGTLTAAGLFGAALIYGDGVITPSISVLSALEGVTVATEALKPYVLPAALLILFALFVLQPKGTARIGRVFGPVMLLWFLVIGLLGLLEVVRTPGVLWALDPTHAGRFLLRHGWQNFVVLGGVVLAVTGGEALYADMGHVGRAPTRAAWFGLVLPALLLSYAGQTALLLRDPGQGGNPFFRLAPHWALVPLVVLATAATIIASQAIITGAFSLTRQAIQLGWLPGMRILQTSQTQAGQIYVPAVNWLMMAGTLALTAGFGSSDRLAGAYGTAVSTTMLLTTVLLYAAMRELWRWPAPAAAAATCVFLIVDLAFFSANLLKVLDGGWIPLALGSAIFLVMLTWRDGMDAIHAQLRAIARPQEAFLARLGAEPVSRVPGTAVFLNGNPEVVPAVLVRHVDQFRSLQQTVVDLTLRFEQVPRVLGARRAEVTEVGQGVWQVLVRFGFMEVPNVPAALGAARESGCPLHLDDAVYLAGRDAIVRAEGASRLRSWRRGLFAFLFRNAVRTPDRFYLPPEKFVEVTRQLAI